MNLYLPRITVFIGFLLFVPKLGNIWMMPDYKATLYWTPNPSLFVKENLENFNIKLGSLYL